MWQALHDEFAEHGVDVVTVALDTPASATPWLEALRPDGPVALIDEALLTVDALGWVNVPSTVWFDERGTIVRGPEISFVKPKVHIPTTDSMPPEQREALDYVNAFPHRGDAWLDALRDWVVQGPASRFARTPDEVVRRSRSYGIDTATAAAHHALAEHLRLHGHGDDAVAHQQHAHRLDPEQWNRKRHTWAINGGTERFATSFVQEMRSFGPQSFYPPVDLDA